MAIGLVVVSACLSAVRLEVLSVPHNDGAMPSVTATATASVKITVEVRQTLPAGHDNQTNRLGSGPKLTPELPALEIQRRTLQRDLVTGWGMFYDMGYLDHVFLPSGARVNLALCEVGAGGLCATAVRIDWPNKAQLPVTNVRLGLHAYDRSYNQLYFTVGDCNVSVTGGGGGNLLLLIEVSAVTIQKKHKKTTTLA